MDLEHRSRQLRGRAQFAHRLLPVDGAFPGPQMLVFQPVIVMDMRRKDAWLPLADCREHALAHVRMT